MAAIAVTAPSASAACNQFNGVLCDELQIKLRACKVLVVGAGGIGCELLKNLVLTGFEQITIIDLDTIDVSNLNRQFLFRKHHVSMSKAKVAKESAQKMNKNAHIVAYHDQITSSQYGIAFFKQFSIVMNALDNRAARNHVNRMCLAAKIPLIESGTAGYLGQVSVIKKGSTECYECQPKATEKTYPGCTIRNTPSEPIHCVVWAKHLFNQLFGEADPDEDVSPDTADPNAAGGAAQSILESKINEQGNVERLSTRSWAASCSYDPVKLFNKLFNEDIKYLLSMENLWVRRRAPVPQNWEQLPDAVACSSKCNSNIRDQRLWSVQECASVFSQSIQKLKDELETLKGDIHLPWDKDNDMAMDFVAACANIRAHIFGIPQKSRFDIKSMAGNIIPAIATTNAIIAGLIVMEALKILEGNFADCKAMFLNKQPHPKTKHLLSPCSLVPPNPNCTVCSEKPEVTVQIDTNSFTVRMLEEKVLKNHLNMIAPDVEIDDGRGTILISSEEGETTDNNDRCLSEFHIVDGTRLKCDDFLQNYQLIVNIMHGENLEGDKEFEILGSLANLHPSEDMHSASNGTDKEPAADDDDLVIVDTLDEQFATKRTLSEDSENDQPSAKKMRQINDSEEIISI